MTLFFLFALLNNFLVCDKAAPLTNIGNQRIAVPINDIYIINRLIVQSYIIENAVDTVKGKRFINILHKNSRLVKSILLPTQDEKQGFALNWVRKNKLGFEISVECGTSVNTDKTFYFIIENGEVYCNKIKRIDLRKFEPRTQKTELIYLNPKVNISNFDINKYIR